MSGDENGKTKAWGAGRVAFMAHRTAIFAALAEGWPASAVHASFKDRIGVGYRQFNRYVAAERKAMERDDEKETLMQARRAARSRSAKGEPSNADSDSERRGFHFDPADLAKKTLI
jgi:hypothetical protein